jgi:cyclase
MKTTVVLAFLVAGNLAASAAPEPIEHIKDNVYKIFGGGGNTLVVVQPDGVVLVDTKLPNNGPAILSEVKKVTDKPIKLIINTHSHPDHVGSNDYIREQYPNVRIVMNEGAKEELSGPQSNPKLLPTETYTDHMTIGSGADQIELYHFGRGHTNGDTFVLFSAARLLCMGDVMAWNMAPFLPAGGAELIAQETEALVKAVKGKVDLVEEGHGHMDTWADLERLAPLARAHMNVNVAYTELAGETIGFGIANGAPLAANDKHKGSDPKDTAPPTPEMLAAAVAK